jgi:hypothetical protein
MKKRVLYPKNKFHFKKLVPFAKKIFSLLNKSKIKSVIYSSYATFYHAKDENLEVHDIDLLIADKDYPKIMELLRKNKIEFKFMPEWDTLEIKEGKLKFDIDRMGEGGCKNIKEGGLPSKTIKIDFYGTQVRIVTPEDLYDTYYRGYIRTTEDKEKLKEKLNYLKKFLK